MGKMIHDAAPPTSLKIVRGSVDPRLAPQPLRPLTPETSYGFDVIEFARDVVGMPLDPWQERAVIIGGELLESGIPRWRKVLLIVARQNGKTHLMFILILYWLFIERCGNVLGINTKLEYAKVTWQAVYDAAEANPAISRGHLVGQWTDNNSPRIEVAGAEGGRVAYRIAAMGRKAGRSQTIRRLFIDEPREHQDWETWKAAYPTISAVFDGQAWLTSNQGDEQGVVLKSLRESGIAGIKAIEAGQDAPDPDLCLIEYSAPEGARPLDVHALAQANPNMNRRGLSSASLLADARRALDDSDPKQLAGFRTEIMCQYVPQLDPAIDPEMWADSYVPGDLAGVQRRVLCFDISPDMQHATIVAGALLPDDRVRLVVVEAFHGSEAVKDLRRQIFVWARKIIPAAIGWFPNGPGAALAADIRERKDRRRPLPPSMRLEEISGEVAAVCMGFSSRVAGGQVIHGNEPLLNTHVTGAAKRWNGDVWRFERQGEGHVDAAYAGAGADHLARTLPRAMGKPRLITASA